ncbi:SDR family oxidoreductase [Azospirillum sp. RWY-5-1]|uniref:SDR family oxidoreductase n=1 Tax=Azospirillum oleiclasticum TaxID=2735135 RepID=A0ABX2TJF2_9PROT|nr:SDR family oxidoreductase [Azospirillum oleiclasticum]NYZ17127.1 SDR family oxidoreductase [Azospirillum oleiclasticum]NYZ24264.1 SDR family oxidoreductase [Azospirillum oleiclasticum]
MPPPPPADPLFPTDPLFDVSGLSVLVAGGAGGLGAVLARAFAERGARVLAADLARAVAAAEAAGTPAVALDVTDEASCAAAMDEAVRRHGRLDVLINASGVYRTGPALEFARADWDAEIAVNLTGAFLLARAAGRVLTEQGSGAVITLASVSSAVANPAYAAYAASKAGVAHLTRVLAQEWAPRGVRVNAIGPAMTETAMTRGVFDDPGHRTRALARIPMGRFGRPEDLVGAAVFLASPAGAFVTGQTLFVDGGRTVS